MQCLMGGKTRNGGGGGGGGGEQKKVYFDLVKTYSYTMANGAIWLATLLAIYSSTDIE